MSLITDRSSLSSPAASSSYCPSGGGDDRSLSGSSDTSDTSRSDWSGTVPGQTDSMVQHGSVGGVVAPLQSLEKLSISQGNRPTSTATTEPLRQLQEVGRQSSADSGLASGSHSSTSSGTFSWCSLDVVSTQDFGCVFSCPPRSAQELNPCSCPSASGHEYQVPTSLRYLYDLPRTAWPEGGAPCRPSGDSLGPSGPSGPSEPTVDSKQRDGSCNQRPTTADTEPVSEQPQGLQDDGQRTRVAPSGGHSDSSHICISKAIVTICSVCGGFKASAKQCQDYYCQIQAECFCVNGKLPANPLWRVCSVQCNAVMVMTSLNWSSELSV